MTKAEMTKTELIEALKDFPDDMEVRCIDDYDVWLVKSVEMEEGTYWFKEKPFILIRP